jgi:prevent-host-death family protein
MMIMPNIKPKSDLRNYTEVLNEVKEDSPVYLTRNGRGEYAIINLKELDKLKSTIRLLAKLEEGEKMRTLYKTPAKNRLASVQQ